MGCVGCVGGSFRTTPHAPRDQRLANSGAGRGGKQGAQVVARQARPGAVPHREGRAGGRASAAGEGVAVTGRGVVGDQSPTGRGAVGDRSARRLRRPGQTEKRSGLGSETAPPGEFSRVRLGSCEGIEKRAFRTFLKFQSRTRKFAWRRGLGRHDGEISNLPAGSRNFVPFGIKALAGIFLGEGREPTTGGGRSWGG